MNAPSTHLLRALRQAPAFNTNAGSIQRINFPKSTPWICGQCSCSRLLSTASRNYDPPLRRSIGRPLSQQKCRAKTFSSSNHLRDDDRFRSDLPSAEEGRRSHASKRFDHVMDNIQSNIFIAGQRLNDLTGYSGIEALRKEIEKQGPAPIA